MSQSNANDLTIFGDYDYWGGNIDLSQFEYPDLSKIAGPSRGYTGADIPGDFDSYQDHLTPSNAPIFMFDGPYLEDG